MRKHRRDKILYKKKAKRKYRLITCIGGIFPLATGYYNESMKYIKYFRLKRKNPIKIQAHRRSRRRLKACDDILLSKGYWNKLSEFKYNVW